MNPCVGYTTSRSCRAYITFFFYWKPREFGLEDEQFEERLKDPSLFSLEKTWLRVIYHLIAVPDYLMVVIEKMGPHSSQKCTVEG